MPDVEIPTRASTWRAASRNLLACMTAVVAVGACSTDDTRGYEEQPMAFHAIGGWQLEVAGKAMTVDLDDRPATHWFSHRSGADGTCMDSVQVLTERQDGSCKSTLRFEPATNAPGMVLAEAVLVVRAKGVPDCAPVAEALGGADDLELKLSGGKATLPTGGWSESLAAQPGSPTPLNKAYLWPRGVITMSGGSHSVQVNTDGLRFGGDATSEDKPGATCTPCTSGPCVSPFPAIRMRDIQPESVAFNLTYGMDVFAGQPLMAFMQAGW